MALVNDPYTFTNNTVADATQVNARVGAILAQVNGNLDDRNMASTLVTALPASPRDGQVVDFLADATNGVVWRFRYRAASSSAYKWEFVGGAALYSEVAASESTLSTTYVALTTAGPSITLPTLPAGGDFDVAIGAYFPGSSSALMSFDIAGTGAVDADAIQFNYVASETSYPSVSLSRVRRKTGLAGGAALVAKYRAPGGFNSTFANRFMSVVPVRVG